MKLTSLALAGLLASALMLGCGAAETAVDASDGAAGDAQAGAAGAGGLGGRGNAGRGRGDAGAGSTGSGGVGAGGAGPCACTLEYAPVCGTNGKTYGNACEASCAGVTARSGACPADGAGGGGGTSDAGVDSGTLPLGAPCDLDHNRCGGNWCCRVCAGVSLPDGGSACSAPSCREPVNMGGFLACPVGV